MAKVEFWEIEGTSPQNLSVSGTASVASTSRLGKSHRTAWGVTPTTAGMTLTVVLGDASAAALAGQPLQQWQPMGQSMVDSGGRGVFQGTIQLIASGSGNASFWETFEP